MIPSWANQSIVRLRASTKTERGSEVPDWANVDQKNISPCSVQPSASSISIDGRVLGLIDSYTVYCDLGVDVKAGDRVIYEGQTFVVNEDPRNWHSPTGRVSSTQFTMVRWQG